MKATVFSAVITGDQEVPGVTTTASGTGSFTLNAAKTELSFKITVNGLSAISAAHFHNGAAGVSAGVVRGFSASEITSASTDAWSVTGTWSSTDTQPLTPALVQELEAGNIYVNFHTTAHGSGEIRGQLKPLMKATVFSTVITGDQEVPGVTTTASGFGTFTLNAAKTQLSFKIKVYDLSAIAAAHFHNGPAGVSAGVVRGFSASEIISAGTNAWRVTGTWTSTDAQPLTPALVQELEAGNIYVNFHTTAHGSGEIRGQLEPL